MEGHGDVHEQIDSLTRRLEAEGPDPSLYLARAGRYRLHGDFDQALLDLDRAGNLDPNLPALDRIRGGLLLEAGQPGQALAALNRFLGTHPPDGEALLIRARVHVQLKKPDAAVDDYDHAIAQLDRPTPDVFLERARVLLAHDPNATDRALEGLDQGIRTLGPIPSLQNRAIDLELERENPAAALDRLRTLYRDQKGTPHLLLRKGEILQQSGQSDAAQTAFFEALALIEALPASRRSSPSTRALEQQVRRLLHQGGDHTGTPQRTPP